MAQTFEIACHNCQRRMWIGQREVGDNHPHLYGDQAARLGLQHFLFLHVGHRLEVNDTQEFVHLDYQEDCWGGGDYLPS